MYNLSLEEITFRSKYYFCFYFKCIGFKVTAGASSEFYNVVLKRSTVFTKHFILVKFNN